MMLLLLTLPSFAGGGGPFFEIAGGAASSAATGFATRGTALSMALGAYGGAYHGSFRYGRYWRLEGAARFHTARAFRERIETSTSIGPRLTWGADLLRFGASASISAGPAILHQADSLGALLTGTGPLNRSYGAFVRGSLTPAYNFNHLVALTLRFDFGLQFDSRGVSTTQGFLVGVCLRAPLYRHGWEIDPEAEPVSTEATLHEEAGASGPDGATP